MFKLNHLRKSHLAIAAVVLISVISSADATFAQVTYKNLVTVPDPVPSDGSNPPDSPASPAPTASPASPGSPSSPTPTASGFVDFSGVASVNAKEIALVSLVSRQVELAKTPRGAKAVAKVLVAQTYHWSAHQISCLNVLWDGESHWNFQSTNKYSGAHGIAQANPASKMESVASDWRTNPVTQIKWGLGYIHDRYGTPCNALAKKHWLGYY